MTLNISFSHRFVMPPIFFTLPAPLVFLINSGYPFVSDAPHRQQMLGCGRIVFNFHSQSAYVDIDYLLFAEVVATPDFSRISVLESAASWFVKSIPLSGTQPA